MDAPERLGRLEQDMERLIHDFYGNGQEGLLTQATKFFAEYRENRKSNIEFQNQRDAENAKRESRRWKLATIILTAFGLLLGILTYLEANRQIHNKFSSAEPGQAVSYSHPPQDASRF